MTTIFAMLMQTCGLSHREAADVLHVRIDTVKSWSSGRRQAPQDALAELAALSARIEGAATEALAQIDAMADQHGIPEEIDLGIASDDVEARSIGWPCVGAQCASVALIVARGMQRGYKFGYS